MALRRTSRKFELFSMHAHNKGNKDYTALLEQIASRSPADRTLVNEESALAISQVEVRKGLYFLTIVEGPVGVNPLIYDLESATERTEELDTNEVLVVRTHCLVDPSKRRAAIEYVRRGAKYFQVAAVMQHILRSAATQQRKLSLELAPIVEADFIAELKEFERIRSAKIVVNKPNASWSNHYTQLSGLMESSNGAKAAVEVNAPRGGSLKKRKGIIKVIKDIVDDKQPYLQEANVTGVRTNEDAETRLSLKNHVKHSRAMVSVDESGHVNEAQAYRHLKGLLE